MHLTVKLQVKEEAKERTERLYEAYENAQNLLKDVDLALEWLTKNRMFDAIRKGKLDYQRETDTEKKLDLVQVDFDKI